MNSIFKSKWQTWLPDVLVVSWLLFLGVAIWQHALHSSHPPFYDQLSYMEKAMHFWQAVEQGKPFNPMNLNPVVRPPGTILMSYPFGFSHDFIGFQVRSIFLPILCVVVSVYIVSGSIKFTNDRWWVASIAFLFSSLPMFYQFDLNNDNGGLSIWGSVDNFQAGIAAMAMAAAIKSTVTKSQAWLLFAISLAAFTLLIKPSGLMIMALLALAWLVMVTFERRCASRLQIRARLLSIYALKGVVGFLIIYGCAISICVFSEYFSEEVFTYAKQTLVIMAEVLRASFQVILMQFHKSSGEALPLWIMGVTSLFLYLSVFSKKTITQFQVTAFASLLCSLIIWVLGSWYWLVVQAGGNQIRYFYPFMLMSVVCVVPAGLYIGPRIHHMVRWVFFALCIIPALNIAGLLMAENTPSIFWQKLSGVNVSVGGEREDVQQAYSFLENVREAGKSVKVYSFHDGLPSMLFEIVGIYEKLIRPDQLSFDSYRPIDWQRGFVVRINEMLACDYILIKKIETQEIDTILNVKNFDSFEAERRAFEAWLLTLREGNGVRIDSEGQTLRLLHIDDPVLLKHGIEEFVSEHIWRPEFVSAVQ